MPPGAADRPIGYQVSPRRGPTLRGRIGGAFGLVTALGLLILKIFVIGHVASSIGGPSSELQSLEASTQTLTESLNASTSPQSRAAALQAFDARLQSLDLSGQADADRSAAIAADETYVTDLDAGAGSPSVDQGNQVRAVNRLAHDLGASRDILTLTFPGS